MTRRAQIVLYVVLSFVDFVSTVVLVTGGVADEANPIIRGFVAFFPSFSIGLAVYKLLFLGLVLGMLRHIQRQSAKMAGNVLMFANGVMLVLGGWHAVCLSRLFA